MKCKLISWTRGLKPVELGIFFSGVAWVGIVFTMSFMTQSLKAGLGSGAAFLVPLGLAVVVVQRCLIGPAKRKLAVEKDWAHPKTAAITAGIFISFVTVLIMMVVVTVGFGIVNAARSAEGLAALFDLAKLPTNLVMLFYVTAVGLAIGSWVWIPIGVGLGLWMRPAGSVVPNL